MMSAIFIAAGLCLLFLLLLVVSRFSFTPKQLPGGSKVERTLQALRFQLPSRLLGERICSRQDLDFVAAEAHDLQQKFLRERKAVMFLWLQDMRNSVVQVMGFYRASVRTSASVNPVVEIRLAANYVAFLLLGEIARGLVWLRGPFAARAAIAHVVGATDRVCSVAGRLLEELDPLLLEKIKTDWSRQTHGF